MSGPPEPTPGRWVEITVTADPADVELVADALSEVAPAGVAILPAIRTDDDREFGVEELPLPARVVAAVAAPLPPHERARLELRLAELPLGAPLGAVEYRDVAESDWSEEWKRFYTLQRIGRRLVVRPSWTPYEARAGEAVVALDPGMAFGTGQHETTRLCLEALERLVRDGTTVLDVGTGSGVLAIAAVKLGAASVRALDTDAGAVAVATENAARNDAGERIEFATGSLGDAWPWREPPRGCAALVVVNISAAAVEALMPELAEAVAPGGALIASGFIARDAPGIAERARLAGLGGAELTADGDWWCLVARRERRER
ncbi:MAG: 50S ribosomal protein L11 methyltransferase [Chloroflexi bacterium]|nr:50S ribosomal protein L11 methyltransferase [Chloroflexota bacterium]